MTRKTTLRLPIASLCLIPALLLAGCTNEPPRLPLSIAEADPEAGRLVVFVEPGRSAMQDQFIRETLPQIESAGREIGATVTVVDVRHGAPEEVHITPLVAFINYRGRSIYQGRFTTLDRLKTFVRGARRNPQADVPLEVENTPVWSSGRAKIGAPIKVAPLTGALPENHDAARFQSESRAAVISGLKRFRDEAKTAFARADRRFYMDFNAWLSSDGTLFVSTALFSQFHCEEPVFTNDKAKIVGPWADRARLFAAAATQMETAVAEQLARFEKGDGFDPVTPRIAAKNWNDLGLALPQQPLARTIRGNAAALPREWRVRSREPGEDPPILFHFAAPLDLYAGEVRTLGGGIFFGEGNSLAGAMGGFAADARTISMGVEDLDAILQSGVFLKTDKHPQIIFELARIESDAKTLGVEPVSAILHGNLELKGKRVPLAAKARIEPVAAPDDSPRLRLLSTFDLNIDAFGLPTPDGPAPAKFTIEFDVAATLEPAIVGGLSDEPQTRPSDDGKGEPAASEPAGAANSSPASMPAIEVMTDRATDENPDPARTIVINLPDPDKAPKSLLGRPLMPRPPVGQSYLSAEMQLAQARADFEADPNDPDKLIWVARRLGYLWRMQEAIDVLSEGIRRWPDNAALYRHRGHRYISLRQFAPAIADFEQAAKLIEGKPDEIEPDGQPNPRNTPLSTRGFNVWYHLGVARYCNADFAAAAEAFARCREFSRGFDDNVVAIADWHYLALRRAGKDEEAKAVLAPIKSEMDLIENAAYHRRLLLYRGDLPIETLLEEIDKGGPVTATTLGYGVGAWYLLNNDPIRARAMFERITSTDQWPAFAYVAAEAELARMAK